MIPVLEEPEIRHRALPVSVHTYHWMQQHGLVSPRAELIRGVIVEKTSKSPLHRRLTRHLEHLLSRHVPAGFLVMKEDPLTLSDSEPEPDIAVVQGQERDFDERHPSTAVLVAEVSVTTAAADREMLTAYASAGVTEVWLVLAGRREVERFTGPSGGHYTESRVFAGAEHLESTVLSGFALPLSELFDSKPADDAS